jgi:PIN domain nuclease of toxin-antitoxin system
VIVLDTHVLIWWVTGHKKGLSQAAQTALTVQMHEGAIIISSISVWEIAMLVSHGRLALTMDSAQWISMVEQIKAVRFIPVDNEIGLKSCELPGTFHKDPADRLIVATARKLAAPLLTADEKILAYPHVQTIW